MSQSIYRVEYKNIPAVDGNEHATFIAENFSEHSESHTFYINEADLKKLKRRRGLTKREKELLATLTAEVKAHGDFDISIAY